MTQLEQILKDHARKYPRMQPADAVKLIYQNEFGGGHLIRDEQECLGYLYREYAAVAHDPDAPLYEQIGNGIVRVNLAAVAQEDVETLGRAFLNCAALHHGSIDRFREKLQVLVALAEQGIFSFDAAALREYLIQYEKAGFPVVSHSSCYREAYKPAYRIVLVSKLSDLSTGIS